MESTPLPSSNNPYEAPADFEAVDQPVVALEVPAGFFEKFGMALRLLFGNLPMVGAIVLTFWLPGNFVVESILESSQRGGDFSTSWRLNTLAEAVLGPPVTGAILAVLAAQMEGRRPGYRSALRIGIGSWGALFGASLMAGVLITLGFLLLVVPGIVLAVRYALIAPVVVLENEGANACRARSAQLVKGHGWQIALVWLATTSFVIGWSFIAAVLAQLLPPVDSLWGTIACDCVGDVLGVLLTVWLFLYYWEAARSGSKKPLMEEPWMDQVKPSDV